jgi:Domain of unknown function (DUF4265)
MSDPDDNEIVVNPTRDLVKSRHSFVRRGLDDLPRMEAQPIEAEVHFRWLGSESMSLTPLGSKQFRVECSPAMLARPAALDVIEADTLANGSLKFRRVVKRSGLKQHRYSLPKDAPGSQAFTQFVEWLGAQGGIWQIVFGGWLILDVPPELSVDEIKEKLRPVCSATANDLRSTKEYPKEEVRFRLPD